MHIEARWGHIDRIYLHTNEGDQVEGGAAGLVNYLHSIDGGYHVVVDDKETVRAAADQVVVWGEGGDNENALAVCMIGRAAQDWTTPYSVAETERAAQQVATWCKAWQVPEIHVAPGAPGQAPTQRGIAEHADDHDPASQGHTDPGTGFPIAAFVARVAAINAPIDWALLKALADWKVRVTAKPLHIGENDVDVETMNALLTHAGWGSCVGSAYGVHSAEAIARMKAHFGNTSPATVFGGTAATEVL
jgi:hypothetical protein